jgi:Alginate export
MTKMKLNLLAVAVAASVGASAQVMAEDPAETIAEAVKEGDVSLSFRMRFEDVDQDVNGGDDKSSSATTLKTRLTYKTADFNGFSGLVEMDDVTELGSVDYVTSPFDATQDADAAAIADPEGTEVNQAWLAYTYNGNTVKYGRQRILLDNQRFVGGVGFRQNEQTYDGLTFKSTAIENTEIFLAYIDRVNRIFGEDRKDGEPSNLGDHDNSTKLFNISYSGLPIGKLTAYHYDIDNEETNAVKSFSTKTSGLRLAGKYENFGYAAEYAKQSDAHDNPSSYDAKYYLVEGSVKLGDFTLKAGQEVLGADDSDGYFITPLATLHKFQGWSDKFLNFGKGNLPGGIEDTYASISTKVAGVKLSMNYHSIDSDDSSVAGTSSYGSEYGFVAAKKFGDYGLSLKYSKFSEDDDTNSLTDTSKLWLTATAKF